MLNDDKKLQFQMIATIYKLMKTDLKSNMYSIN
jgi:hypothetical protein